jgi:hypothetical protein
LKTRKPWRHTKGPRTTKLYHRTGDEFTPDEAERIRSEPMVAGPDPKTSSTGTILRLYR